MAGLALPGRPGTQTAPSMNALSGVSGARPASPPRFAPGPYGTAYQFSPSQFDFTTGRSTPGSWTQLPVPDTRTKEQIEAESLSNDLAREQLQASRFANAATYMGQGTGGGVPSTTRARSASGGVGGDGVSGPTPTLAQIKSGMDFLQPDIPSAPTVPTVPGPQVPAPTPEENQRASELAYGRAKDRIAMEGEAARRGLEREATQRGITGTGLEGKRRTAISRASMAGLSAAATQQAAQDLARSDEFAKLGYAGGMQQRGQDIQALLARYNAQLAARGQTIGAQPNPIPYIGALTALSQAGGSLY